MMTVLLFYAPLTTISAGSPGNLLLGSPLYDEAPDIFFLGLTTARFTALLDHDFTEMLH